MAVYFALIGTGYMFVEIALIQRLGILLGHPTYGFTVTLFALLGSSGLGSAAYGSQRASGRSVDGRWFFGVAATLAMVEAVSRLLLVHSLGWGIAPRIAAALAVTAPAGFGMGFGFPAGMDALESWPTAAKGWCWAVNGAFSVIGSVLAMVASFTGGIRLTFWIGALCYAALALVYSRSSSGRRLGVMASGDAASSSSGRI